MSMVRPDALPQTGPLPVDFAITGAIIVTMDEERRIITDGAIAVAGDAIAAIGKTAEVLALCQPQRTIDGRRFVITPGMINAHIHVTGEPLTRGVVPDDSGFSENVFEWLVPLYHAYGETDERLSAQCAALEMLRTGTTAFLEAGTIRFLDAVVDGLEEVGIRGRVGQWAWDFDPATQSYPTAATDAAVDLLLDEIARFPAHPERRIAAWPILVGHMTCSDPLWQAAKLLADQHGLGFAAHMSPVADDAAWFVARHGRRPLVHLAELGVLGPNLTLTHAVHLSAEELGLLAESGTNIAHCPTSAIKGAYGATAVGLFPEMQAKGVTIGLGTDGNNNANAHDLMRAAYLMAGLFKDARQDPKLFPAEQALTAATLNGAKILGASESIGALAVGRKADFVAHDSHRPEWRPLFDPVSQLVWSADGRSVHSVWVDGRRVVDDFRLTTIDEDRLLAESQVAGEAILARSGLSLRRRWPVV